MQTGCVSRERERTCVLGHSQARRHSKTAGGRKLRADPGGESLYIQEKMSKRQADTRPRALQSPQSGPKLGNHQHEDGMDFRGKEYTNARSEWALLQGTGFFQIFQFL